jgi:predicted transcriptional regulator
MVNATASRFMLPPAVYEQAMAKARGRNKRFLTDYVESAAKVLGVTPTVLSEAIEAETAARTKAEKQDKAKAKLDDAVQAVKAVKLSAADRKAVSELHDICSTLGQHCEVTLSPDGALVVNVQNSELSAKSVISPWLAYERGVKAGDTFRIEKVGTRHYKAESGEEFTNLTGWIRQNQPNSQTAAILKRYGQL